MLHYLFYIHISLNLILILFYVLYILLIYKIIHHNQMNNFIKMVNQVMVKVVMNNHLNHKNNILMMVFFNLTNFQYLHYIIHNLICIFILFHHYLVQYSTYDNYRRIKEQKQLFNLNLHQLYHNNPNNQPQINSENYFLILLYIINLHFYILITIIMFT